MGNIPRHTHTCLESVPQIASLVPNIKGATHINCEMAGKRKLCDEEVSDNDDWGDGSVCEEGQGFTTRKRRRGQIEKKRRDRINESLNELRKLVPAALEKSSSTKLEKAEILQMTVEHLRMLPNKGDYSDPRLAMEYHSVGFRECVAEVSRYLLTVEGLDIHNTLCIRLMSHLNTFSSYSGWNNYPVVQNSMDRRVRADTTCSYSFPSYQSQPNFSSSSFPAPRSALAPEQHSKHYRPWGAEMPF